MATTWGSIPTHGTLTTWGGDVGGATPSLSSVVVSAGGSRITVSSSTQEVTQS